METPKHGKNLLVQVSQALVEISHLDDAIQRVADLLAEGLDYDRVVIITFDLRGQQVTGFYPSGPGAPDVVRADYAELWDGLSGWALRHCQPALSPKNFDDDRESPAVRQRRQETSCGAIAVVPIQFKDNLLGTLTVINRPDQRDMDDADVDLLTLLSNQVAAAIENNRLFRELAGEIRERAQAEQALQKAQEALEQHVADRTTELNAAVRALRTLSDCNQVLVRSQSEQELMSKICKTLVHTGGYRMAWIGFCEQDEEKTVRPVAWEGFEEGYLASAQITWADTPRGRGPTGTAIRTRRPAIARDILNDPAFAPWREQALKRGYRSVIGLPLLRGPDTLGAITIYAERSDAYDQAEVTLLVELVEDLVYGLTALRTRAAQLQAAESLRESQANLEKAQALAHMGSWEMDLRGSRNFWSAEMFRLFRLDPANGVPPLEKFMNYIHPEDRSALLDAQQRVIATRQSVTVQYRISPALGEIRYYEATLHARVDAQGELEGLSGIVVDNTDRRLMELFIQERLKELTCLYQTSQVLENVQNRSIPEVLQACLDLLPPGMQFPELAEAGLEVDGENWQTAGFQDDLACRLEAVLTINNRAAGKLVAAYTENRPFIIPEEKNLLDNLARMIGLWLERTRSETALRASEESLRELTEVLEQRVNERTTELRESRDQLSEVNFALEKASRLKDEFLASMSHELRTPLTGILGLSEVLQYGTYGPLTEKQEKAIRNIESSGRHLLELINDILDLSKIEAGKLDLNIETCSLTDICQAAMQLTKGMAHQKNLKMNFSMNATSVQLQADPRRLKQMLVNLLSNAVKFTEPGGAIGLEVLLEEENQVVHLTVWDTGIGIKPENMDRLFKSFSQIDSSLTRQYAGTGLGLALVQRMTEMHGGSVEVSSVYGEGSRFTIHLPYQGDASAAPSHASKTNRDLDTGLIKNTLTIEDNPLDAELVTSFLNTIGIQNIIHPAARGALEKAVVHHPSAILLDIRLPDLNGLEVLRQLQRDARTRAIPVIVTSADERRAEAAELGARGYLVKPFTLDDLRRALSSVALPHEQTRPVLIITPKDTRPAVMIADDNEQILDLFGDYLEAQNYTVTRVRSGIELLNQAVNVQPDLFIVDVQMPGMDGLETIRRLRAHTDAGIAQAPVIAVTALAMTGDRERILEAGANEYLAKPVSLLKLGDVVTRFMAQARS